MNENVEAFLNLLPGLWESVQMGAVALAIGIPVGFLAGLALNSRKAPLRWLVTAFVELFRGFPALVTLYLVYFGLADILTVDRFVSVVIAFGITCAAYTAEIFRAAIGNVPRGQIEAAEALAMNPGNIVRKIIVPHVLNVVVAPILGIAIIVFQGTSLAYAIGAKELLGTAYSAGMVDFRLLPQLLMAAVLYLLVTSGLAWMEILADRRAAEMSGRRNKKKSVRRTGVVDPVVTA